MMGKNSKLNKNSKHETFVKVKIRNKTENTGFLDKITKKEDNTAKPAKK